MIRLLARPFLKEGDSEDRRRQVYGTVCGGFGVGANLLLCTGKIIAGLLCHSLAVVADGLNNLSDAATSILTLWGFRMANKKPDKDHPFGHGRIEYLTGLAVSVLVILLGFELGKSAISQIITPTAVSLEPLSLIVLCIAIPVKLLLYLLNRKTGRLIGSTALLATATDCITDALASTVTLVTLFLSGTVSFPIDGICGGALAVLILVSGVRMVLDTISPLLGQTPDPAFVKQIVEITGQYPEVLGIHDLIVHDYGPGRRMVSLHAEIDSTSDLIAIHEIIDELESKLMTELNCPAVIHMDPIMVQDARLGELKALLTEIVKQIHPSLSVHDVRLVDGTRRCNVIFDLVIPEDGLDEKEIEARVKALLYERAPIYRPVMRIERSFVALPDEE